MRLSNASYASFGHFLAREMAHLGYLEDFYTNLPRRRVTDVPPAKTHSQPLLAAAVVADHLNYRRVARALTKPTIKLFERWVARNLRPCDVFHCFSSFGLAAHHAARDRFGAMTVVERGSSHIGFQNNILKEEYARWGVPFAGIDSWMVDRELREYEECDRITVQSTFAEKTFVDKGIPREKLIKLPLGVDVRMFQPAEKRDDVFRVLYAGGCSVRKGIPYLLEAIAPLSLAKFELAINGRITEEVRPMIERHPRDLRLLGLQPLPELYKTYSQASVLVLPTIEDGFAKVITEAMACGVPVIATTNCGAMDVMTDGVEGFIVPIRDASAIREKVLFLYENPEIRTEMGRAALKTARNSADWRGYGAAAAAAYKVALGHHNQAAA